MTDGKMKEMSFDHKPYNQLERTRIEKAGGSVEFKRVDGDLAVSRAFGDFQYKTSPELPPEEQKVSPEPEIIIHDRSDADEFLLLACDGLWDVMSNSEAAEAGRGIFQEGSRTWASLQKKWWTCLLKRVLETILVLSR